MITAITIVANTNTTHINIILSISSSDSVSVTPGSVQRYSYVFCYSITDSTYNILHVEDNNYMKIITWIS